MNTAQSRSHRNEFNEALGRLKSRQKTSKGAPAYSLLVNRRLGRILAAAAHTVGLSPNQVTGLSAVFTFIGIVVLAVFRQTVWTSLIVAMALVVGYALDAADGQLARLQGGGTVAGEWLDHAVDALKIATIHSAVLINWFQFHYMTPPVDGRSLPGSMLLVPLVFQMVASVQFFVIILNDQIRRARRGSNEMILQGDGRSSFAYSIAVVPTDYGLLCLSFLIGFWTIGFRYLYSFLMLANLCFLLLALVKWFHEMKRYE